MDTLTTCFVSLARIAHHTALIHKASGGVEQAQYWEALVDGYIRSAREFKRNERQHMTGVHPLVDRT